jgi:hypothetical protein
MSSSNNRRFASASLFSIIGLVVSKKKPKKAEKIRPNKTMIETVWKIIF